MIPFWWACWTAWQTWTNRARRSFGASRFCVAVVGDRHAADQLHHEVGAAVVRAAGVEHAGDVRVIHQGQRLPLGLEPGDHVARVHPGLEDLERDLAADRLGLLGDEDQAEAALTDVLHQPVWPDPVADFRSRWAAPAPAA